MPITASTTEERIARRLELRARDEKRSADLTALAKRLEVEVVSGPALCIKRLTKRTHRCTSNACYRSAASGGNQRPCLDVFDHEQWLRDHEGRWYLLCQPYHYDAEALTAWCEMVGVTCRELDGPSPYGLGTHAVLISGR